MSRADINKHRLRAILFALVAGVLMLLAFGKLIELVESHRLKSLREEVEARISVFSASLEQRIGYTLYKTQSLATLIAVQPYMNQSRFERIARNLSITSDEIRMIGLAPNNVVSMIYPLKGNENMLGVEYMQHDEQRVIVERAMITGQTIVAGPMELIQGGVGISSRTPVFLKRVGKQYEVAQVNDPAARYWGLVSVALDLEALIRHADASRMHNLRWALRGRDGLGSAGDVFMGDAEIFELYPVLTNIYLPTGSWQLAAKPVEGWDDASALPSHIVLGGYAFILMVCVLIYTAINNYYAALHLALHDQLTNLPNRRLFTEQLRQSLAECRRHNRRGALLVLDLNKFKPVNDIHGHSVGDKVLKIIAQRLKNALRDSDMVSRIGGDEFLAMLSPGATPPDIPRVAQKIIEAVEEPIDLKDHVIQIGISIGIIEYPYGNKTVEQLINVADQMMYDAKNRGGGFEVARPVDKAA